MGNIASAWKNKALSSKEEQGIALASPVGEVELTDEQLEAIYGGKGNESGNNEHHEQGEWNNGHHEQGRWNNGYYGNNGWYYYDHHWWHHPKRYRWYHHGR
jgi:mersacidin/lichenicidin family type 2 lantibiotic